MSCQEYFKRVHNIVDVIKSLGENLADDMNLKEELPERNRPRNGWTEAQKREAKERIENKTVAYRILVQADRSRYGELIKEVENDFLKGHDDYPKTPTDAYNLLVNYHNYITVNKRTVTQGGLDQVAFVTDGKRQRVEGRFPHIKCFKFSEFGHYKSDCAKKVTNGENNEGSMEPVQVTLITQHVVLAVAKKVINPMWILCDNESTVDVFNNKIMLRSIRKTRNPIRIKGIEGNAIDVEEIGDLLGYGTVYYHLQVTANVLSFLNMARRFKSVVYDNRQQDAFIVTRDDNTTFTFVPSKEGLYFYDFQNSINREARKKEPEEQNTMVINTVEELQQNYMTRELKQVEAARRLYVMMGRPSREDFDRMINSGKILNNPITTEDYKRAEAIYGTDLVVLKGKTMKKRPERVQIELSQAVYEKRNIILAVDIIQVTGLNFLVTVSRTIKFITIMYLVNRKKKTIMEAMKQAINLNKGKGHTVTDCEFTETEDKPIHTVLADTNLRQLDEKWKKKAYE
jgi:hypothetical protein